MLMQSRTDSAASATPSSTAAGASLPGVAGGPAASALAVSPGLLELSWGPLETRLRRGEGALLALNATWVLFAWPGWSLGAFLVALSAAVLMTAYAVNDWHDARSDLRDPKKDRKLVLGLIARRRTFGLWLVGWHGVLVALAAAVQGVPAAAAVATMLAVNALYSWWLKGVPLADLAIVGVWGAAFVAIVGAPPWLCATAGTMTAIMHLFQIQQDRVVDAENHIATTVVLLPSAATVLLALICLVLAALLGTALGPAGALSAAVPVALRVGVRDTGRAWMACRVYCGLVLLLALGLLRAAG